MKTFESFLAEREFHVSRRAQIDAHVEAMRKETVANALAAKAKDPETEKLHHDAATKAADE